MATNTKTSADAVGRRVLMDYYARIAWVMRGNVAVVSFDFDSWGDAAGAEKAALEYLESSENSMTDLVLERDALLAERDQLQAQVEKAEAIIRDLILQVEDQGSTIDLRQALATLDQIAAYRKARGEE